MTAAIFIALALSASLSGLRWLRVAQREHYLAGSVTRFAARWWAGTPANIALGLVAIATAAGSFVLPPLGFLTALAVAAGPVGLSIRGVTSSLAWTSRLRRLAIVTAGLVLVGLGLGAAVAVGIAALSVAALPLLADLALAFLAPIERRLGSPWVEKAARRLRESGATVVALTGSYGKTSTKGYVAQLLGGARRVLPSPASFNNRMGLARAVNEHLTPDVDVFVAEMGTYGRGEIADLCSWIPPEVAVITAIGPVHLERFGNEEVIVQAKAEILEDAPAAVLNVDDARLASLADQQAPRRRVIRVGTDPSLQVAVHEGKLVVEGETVGYVPDSAHPTNVACAAGVALALGISLSPERLAGLSEPEHRRKITRGASGVTIIDDTFNSNPSGARSALAVLERTEVDGRRVVVTPGMVELGSRQREENRSFAAEAGSVADLVVVVGRTNRRALLAGAGGSGGGVMTVENRQQAVDWVRDSLGPDDAVLYENDLPDHYP